MGHIFILPALPINEIVEIGPENQKVFEELRIYP